MIWGKMQKGAFLSDLIYHSEYDKTSVRKNEKIYCEFYSCDYAVIYAFVSDSSAGESKMQFFII